MENKDTYNQLVDPLFRMKTRLRASHPPGPGPRPSTLESSPSTSKNYKRSRHQRPMSSPGLSTTSVVFYVRFYFCVPKVFTRVSLSTEAIKVAPASLDILEKLWRGNLAKWEAGEG